MLLGEETTKFYHLPLYSNFLWVFPFVVGLNKLFYILSLPRIWAPGEQVLSHFSIFILSSLA